MAKLVNHYEIIEQNEKRLQNYLINSLDNKAKGNKSFSIDDQFKFYQTYFSKKEKKNSYIDKDLLCNLLSSNKNESNEKNNKHNWKKDYYLDLISNEKNKLQLFHYDDGVKNLTKVDIGIENEKEINLEDINENNINIDFSIVDTKKNEEQTALIFCDAYSIYEIDTNTLSSKKMTTLEEIPNVFLSEIYVDTFFILSSGNQKNYLSIFSSDNYSMLTRKDFSNEITPLTKGEFLSSNELMLAYNKTEILLCDFRTFKRNSDEFIYSNQIYSIDYCKYVKDFNFFTASIHKFSMFDLRYPSIPVSDVYLNINYSSLEMKPLCSTEEIEDIYIAHDTSRRDMSHLLIYGDYSDREIQPYDEFVKFDLIKNDKVEIEICDTVGYLLNNKIYINFIADNLGGVFLNVYEGIRDIKSRYPPSQVADMKNGIQEESGGEIVPKKLDDNLVELYKKYIINSIYKGDKSEVDFGTVSIGGLNKKMFEIESKRDLVEEIFEESENEKDVEMENIKKDNQKEEERQLTNEEMERIKFLIDDLNLKVNK